ncbi:MAG: endonuclease [Salegentibacter sp.]
MKRIFLLALSALMIACSTDNGDTPSELTPEVKAQPVAVNDSFTATENEAIVISNLLDNDTIVEHARISSFDNQSAQGGVVKDNRDGTYTYTPAAKFTGEDSFDYTICVPGDNTRCSTATVTVSVNDGGSPQANDDTITTVQSVSVVLDGLLENDSAVDGAAITSIDDSATTGAVELNEDGTVSYTPQDGFNGNDSFIYSLCDNDEPEATCSTATVTVRVLEPVAFDIPSDLQDYYSNIAFSTNKDINYEFLSELTIQKHTTILSYGQRHEYLYDADEDPDNPDNVILMYSGESRYWKEYTSGSNSYTPQTFNTEHIYPQSKLTHDDAVSDLHHLRSADASVNSMRLNYPYVEGSGDYGVVGGDGFYPGDEWKGDVARMVFYVNIRYGEKIDKVGNLDLFLEWNREDPVSIFEMQRNNVIEGAQGNRNPFIDNPYLATLIWGGQPAENRWE